MNESLMENIILTLDSIDRKIKSQIDQLHSLSEEVKDLIEFTFRQNLTLTDNEQKKEEESVENENIPELPQFNGFNSLFNPFETHTQLKRTDYTVRPEKDLTDLEAGIVILYLYENEDDADYDEEDLQRAFQTPDFDKESYLPKLNQIKLGIVNLNKGKEPGLYTQTLRLKNIFFEIRYNKVSKPLSDDSYNGLFL